MLTHFKQDIQEMTLIPAGGGVFELVVDGDLVYSKKKTGEFPDEDWVVKAMGKKSAKATA